MGFFCLPNIDVSCFYLIDLILNGIYLALVMTKPILKDITVNSEKLE